MNASKHIGVLSRSTLACQPTKESFARDIARWKDADLTTVCVATEHKSHAVKITKLRDDGCMSQEEYWGTIVRYDGSRSFNIISQREGIIESDDPDSRRAQPNPQGFVAQHLTSNGPKD